MSLFPAQCRAARGLLNWTQERLADIAGVSRSTIKDFECHRHALHRSSEGLLVRAFEKSGVEFLSGESTGLGVRLKPQRENRQQLPGKRHPLPAGPRRA